MDASILKTNQLVEIELIDERNQDKGSLKYPSRIEDVVLSICLWRRRFLTAFF